jgi:hypothetical protein
MANSDSVSLKLDDFDVDGAVRETFERLPQHTRSGFIRRTVAAGAAAVGAVAAWPALALAESSSDTTILNFALALEYLQASFYTEAEQVGALRGALAHQAQVVGTHERAHVKAFKQLLGPAAIKQPAFNFHGRVPQDRGRVRGPGDRRLQGAGAPDQVEELSGRGTRDPFG